jgi:hypothetical protein
MRWLRAASLVLLLLTAACGDDGGGDGGGDAAEEAPGASATTERQPSASGASGYSDEVETSFIDSCRAGAGEDLTDVCRCIYDRFEADIPFEDFQRFDAALAADPTADLPPEFIDLYTDCVLEVAPDVPLDN